MRNLKPGIVFVAGVLVFTLALAALAQSEARSSELPNFHQVNAQLYRGAQPKAGGLPKLKDMGIKTIVNLRGEDDQTRAEGEEAQRLLARVFQTARRGSSAGPRHHQRG